MSAPAGLAGAVAALSGAGVLGRQLATAARAAVEVSAMRKGMALAWAAGLLWVLSAGSVAAQDLVTVKWPTRAGVDLYSVEAQSGTAPWTHAVSKQAPDCPPVPGECSVSFPAPTVATCYRVRIFNLFMSRVSRVTLCHDPAMKELPPLETLGGSAGNPTP